MMPTSTADPLDALLAAPAFGLPAAEKRALLLAAVTDAYQHHFRACEAYRRYCERRGFGLNSAFGDASDLPFLPVQAFKQNASLLRSVDADRIVTRLSSSATTGVPSTVDVDRVTARRQVRALAAVLTAVLGPKRRPFLVLDCDPRSGTSGGLGARGAAVRGFLNFAREALYFMREDAAGSLSMDTEAFVSALKGHENRNAPIVVFGFTYVLYVNAILPLLTAGRRFQLPAGSHVLHIGGWKKLVDQQVSRDRFVEDASRVFGVSPENVVDFYGFTEQMGVTYPDGPAGMKYAPAFAEVVVRDPSTMKPLLPGKEGLLEFVTPLPLSYPGIAVLTDDIGIITAQDDDAGGWCGTRFRVLGRAKKAEVRGCGDIMGEKISRPTRAVASAPPTTSKIRLLFGSGVNHVAGDLAAPIDLQRLPVVEDLPGPAERLRDSRKQLDEYSVDDLIALVSAASRKWVVPESLLAPLRQQGLLFLAGWCESTSLRATSDRSMRGRRGFLDGFQAVGGTSRRLLRAQPRGVVAHWLAGNVPLLSMLTLAQSIITRNANILKSASSFSRVLPALLDSFRGLEVCRPDGRILRGESIADTVAIVYFPREDVAAAEQLSRAADVRLAWGGREAIESIMNLPKRYGTEDIIFGPKLSYMVVGREALETERAVKRLARNAATDASVFDQYACASPHTIFVEKGGKAASPRQVAERLADEMAKANVRIPKAPIDSGTAAQIESVRLRYEFTGELWRSEGTEWTVLFDEDWQKGLADPCYSRVICVRAIDDPLEAAQFAHRGIQTIGLALSGERRLQFASLASARGAERFPELGRMTYFDAPWDGLFPMDRLVRWISLGGPV